MSRGSKSRRSRTAQPEGTESSVRQVWIIAPEAKHETEAQAELHGEIRRLAEADGVTVIVRTAKKYVFRGGPDAHQRFDLVTSRDAFDLYQAIHRRNVLVAAVSACAIRTNPDEDPLRIRHARRLEDFVRYKAAFALLRGPGDPKRLYADFMGHSPQNLCRNSHDPRVLPLHVFDQEVTWTDLHLVTGSQHFDEYYGQGTSRSDSAGRRWSPAPLGHGQDTLVVDGLTLPRGFHWDVKRGTARERLVTSHEVWKIHKGGYANIYPDAYVRTERGHVVWSAK